MKQWGYGEGYQHAHQFEDAQVSMECLPENLAGSIFYEPTTRGMEARIRESAILFGCLNHPEIALQVKRFKMRGSSGKVNLALDGLPDFTCLPGLGPHLRGDITIAPSVDYLERAYDDAKYGAFSKKPFMDIVIPSLTDPTVAPPGKHTMSIFVQYAPYNLKEGAADWPNQREAFGDAVIDTLSEYMPNLKSRILHRQVLSPWDLEQIYGLTEGNIFHGELNLEQLFFNRPVAGWSQYRTPIAGLYLCGAGAHPGGGVTGAPGHNAAHQVIRDWKRGKFKEAVA